MKLALTLVVILLPMPVFACLCAGTQTVNQAYKQSAAIFAGRMIAEEYRKGIKDEFAEQDNQWRGKNRQYEVLVYRFEVTRWYKGDNGTREAVLVTERVRFDDGTESVSDCGLGFTTDIDYLIYAYSYKDNLGTGVCSPTKRLARAQADLVALEKLLKPRPTLPKRKPVHSASAGG